MFHLTHRQVEVKIVDSSFSINFKAFTTHTRNKKKSMNRKVNLNNGFKTAEQWPMVITMDLDLK